MFWLLYGNGAGTDFASKIYATIFAKDNDRGLFVLEA